MSSLRRRRLIEHFDAARPKVLSLDVFDTLLSRPFEHPTHVFTEVHRALTDAGEHAAVPRHEYTRLRVEAEAAARRLHPSGEITVDEVCAELSKSLGGQPGAEALIAAEVATERAFIHLDRDIAALIVHAKEQGVPYVLVSDMYLRSEHILSLLEAAATAAGMELPQPDKVFVSGERRTNKGGRMFDEVLSELGRSPDEVLHVGDNEHSDFDSPKKRGIPAFHYVRETPFVSRAFDAEVNHLPGWAMSHYDLGLRTARAKAYASSQRDGGDELGHFQYGAFVLGPILTLFAEWVVVDCLRHGQDTVFCLMREGHLLAPLIEKAAAAASAKLTVKKLWASRYAVRGASFHKASEPELRSYFAKRHNVPVSTAARDLGFDPTLLRRECGVFHDDPLTDGEIDRVVSSVVRSTELRQQMIETSARKRHALFGYFEEMGVFAADRMTLVDLGWGGTIQATLARVFESGDRRAGDHPRPRHIRGLYLATHEKLLDLPIDSCSADSFLFQLGYPQDTCNILRRTPEILEHSCMPKDGSFRGIDAEGRPESFAQPIPTEQLDQIAAMQAGILHFADLWLPGAANRRRHLTHHEWNGVLARLRATLARSLQNPTIEEVRLFAAWQHDNNDGSMHTEPFLGDDALRESARFMSWEQIMQLSWLECFWPQGLARLVGKGEEKGRPWVAAALRYPALRGGARLLSRSAAAVSRAFGAGPRNS